VTLSGSGPRTLARALVPYPARSAAHLARGHARRLRDLGVEAYVRWTVLKAWLAWRRAEGVRAYRVISEQAARARRRSDTVFVFGSGWSLNELGSAEWAHFAAHDVLGFSGFVYQDWVRTDFHLVRGWDYGERNADRRWLRSARVYAGHIARRGRFTDAVFVLQDEYRAVFARTLLGCRLLPPGATVLPYRTARGPGMGPSARLADGLSHGTGTLCDAVNLAYVLGWRTIVLVGVDLYDSRYFWVPPESTVAFDAGGEMVPAPVNFRGATAADVHPVVRNGLVELMGDWAALFARHGVTLTVYNPRSLLAAVMPVYSAAPSASPRRDAAPAEGRTVS